MAAVHGDAEGGFGKVADAFAEAFDDGREVGAACSVYVEDRLVVDLWAGIADPRTGRPWEEDTAVLVFSTTKGITATLAHMLVERGELDLDAPIATYWPEFAAAGKEGVLVRWLLSHQAGLPFVDVPITLDQLCAWDPYVEALAAQAPHWEPGTMHAYHALSYGHLVGEVIRRITGRTPGRFFADEVAGPLGLRSWIGLPAQEEAKVARVIAAPPLPSPEANALWEMLAGPDSLFGKAALIGQAMPAGGLVTEDGGLNDPRARAAEIPAGNMVTDARSLARFYAATIGEVEGVRLLQPGTVATASAVQTTDSEPYGVVPGFEALASPFALGFQVSGPLAPLLGPRSFGHGGAGGSLGFADPDHGVGFGYVMNQMLTEVLGVPRNQHLVNAVAAALG